MINFKKYLLQLITVTTISLIFITGCGRNEKKTNNLESATSVADSITVGFSQLGAESDWRSENSKSMRESLSIENGFELIFKDGQQKQSNQITAIRSFIQQGVDYIVLAPVTQNGWDFVLEEAKEADIPVIIVDRMVEVSNDSLFAGWVGSDFLLEGQKASEWLHEYMLINGIPADDIHIINIQGTLDSSAQIGRTRGLREAVKKYGWDLRAETPGEFTQAKGREAMSLMLKTYNNINVVYCENDNEALGAIEAIEAAGKHAGTDIKNGDILVISFDGINKEALEYTLDGTIACIVECNPLHGPRVKSIIEALHSGQNPEKFEYVDETLYSCVESISSVTVDGIKYPVTMVTEDMLE